MRKLPLSRQLRLHMRSPQTDGLYAYYPLRRLIAAEHGLLHHQRRPSAAVDLRSAKSRRPASGAGCAFR